MARRNRRRDTTNSIANARVARHQDFYNPSPSYKPRIYKNPYLTLYEDRRQWHPEGLHRPAASFSQARHRLTLLDQPQRSQPMSRYSPWRSSYLRSNFANPLTQRIGFKRPDRVLICVRRAMRREIMFAYKKTGRGAGRQRRPRYNYYSTISCRRS